MVAPSVARFETLTRLGFAARGLTYVLIGWLALQAGRTTGPSEALATLSGDGAGRLVLILVAVGLTAYGAWKLLEAALDLEGAGRDAKGRVARLGRGLSGVAHLILAFTAFELATGTGGGGGDGETTREATSWLLDLPAGGVVVRGLGAALIGVGAYQAVQAVRLRFLKHIDPAAASKAWVKWVGRLGYLARGVVFVLVGLRFWRAGAAEAPGAVGGTGEALGSLSPTSLTIVAAGLVMFGLFSFVQAIYRRITDPQVVERLSARLS